jgi:glycosyltransferase involved in cell wall biosynthesis
MKKVLFVIYSMKYGGAERSLVNLLQELPEDKYEVDLLLFQKKGDFLLQIPAWVRVLETPEDIERLYAPLKETKLKGYTKVMGTVCSRFSRKTKKAQTAYRWRNFYGRKIRGLEKQYDVAVAYAGSENLYFIRDKVRADKKLVWIHNDYRTAGYSKADDQPYFEDMDAIVSVSKECVDVLKEEFPQYRHKMHYVENITSSAVIRKQAELSVPEEYQTDKQNILSVGRLHPQKGFDMAVDAAAILKKSGVNFCWYIIGGGPLREELKQQIKDRDVEDCFILLGTRNNPYTYIKQCAFMVQPSRYEGKSVVLDEAKILATPIVATAYPTVRDQVIDGKEGLITPMTPEGIAEGIREMLENEEMRRSVRDYLAQREYGNQSEVEKYVQLLDM